MNNMLTLEEVRNYLEVDQQKIEELIKQKKLNAYKIGGTYVRFRKDDVLNLQTELPNHKAKSQVRPSFFSKISDFWRFNNFYIISILLIIALAVLVVRL